MRLRSLILTAATLLALATPAFAQKMSKEDKAKLPRLAILEFKAAPDCWYGWTGWGGHMATISDQLRDLFTTQIMEDGHGKIRLVEREQLNAIRGELNFQQSGEVDVATVQKIGKLLGAKYMMTGKVTRFAYKESGFSTGWGVGALLNKAHVDPTAASVASDVHIKKASFTGRLDIRLIEVETGEILGAWKDEDKQADMSVKIAGTGNEVQYDQELVNKVFEPIVVKLTPKLIKATGVANADSD